MLRFGLEKCDLDGGYLLIQDTRSPTLGRRLEDRMLNV